MLTCYLTRRKLGAWIDGALDESVARSTAAHVQSCVRCQAEVDALGRLRSLLRRTLDVAEPDWAGFWPGVVRGIQDRRVPTAPVRAARGWQPRWAMGAAVAALVVSLGVWQLMPGPLPADAGVVINAATTEDPRGTVVAYSTPEQDVAVVWVLGLND